MTETKIRTAASRRVRCDLLLTASSAVALLISIPATAQTAASTTTSQPSTAATAPVNGSPAAPATERPALVAQDAQEQQAAPTNGDIVVTGSRITASGFNAPTPTTVVSAELIQQSAKPNLFATLAELPALQGSTGTTNATQNSNTSVGTNGLSALNLRGLGTIRTLTLLDGQRVVPAYVTGIVDVSQFPQLLIKRVDVVTGGASASWGSDAVAGVVNFVTDKHFEGIKGNLQESVSTYGDDSGSLVQVAAGHAFLDGKLHIETEGEYYNNNGIPRGYVGGGRPSGRPDFFRSNSASYSLAGTPAGAPQNYFYPYNAQDITFGRYGLITAGPLQGTAFDVNGNVTAFQYGGSGTPLRGSTPGVAGCVGTVCQGGDQSGFISISTIDDPIKRIVSYSRVSYDILPKIELYGTVSLSDVKTSNTPIPYPRRAGITISCSNPFLPASVTTACAANNISSFLFGTTNSNFPNDETIRSDRSSYRYVGGADGSFSLFGKPVSFDAHFEHGVNLININIANVLLLPRFNAAVAATRNAAGQIVCASATAVAGGCIPINLFGGTPLTAAQNSYLEPANGPYQRSRFVEDAGSVSFNATPFRNWAGDVAVALGGEWRREAYSATADPYGNGVSATSPNTAAYPADALLSATGNNWFAGNYHNGGGSFNVKEGFLELGVPIFNGPAVGKLDLNVAGRIADYSTAGNAKTWKVGATWDTPLQGLRLRGVVSRDIRAPNLSELFAAPQITTTILINRATGSNIQLLSETVGNSALRPEVAYNREVGFVYRPAFFQNLVVSVDYFNIKVGNAISTLTNQQIIDLCYNGNTTFCSAVNLTGTLGTANPPYVLVQPFNLASLKTSGLDFEASYRIGLGRAGTINLHGLATHVLNYVSDPGIPGQIVQQLAGDNAADTPSWKANLTETWTSGQTMFLLTQRIVSAGQINPNYITCSTACPMTTVQNPTTNFNYIPGAVYLDAGITFNVRKDFQVYFKADNVTNHLAPPFGSTTIYDVIGRVFRAGVRVGL